MNAKNLPVRLTMCATCPWREGSPYEYLRNHLERASLSTARICHSTGRSAIHRRTGKKPHICRGSRDWQLGLMAGFGVIGAATDEAWNERRVMTGMSAQTIKDP